MDIIVIENDKIFVWLIYVGNVIVIVESLDEVRIIIICGIVFFVVELVDGIVVVEEGVDFKVESVIEWVGEDFVKLDRFDFVIVFKVVSGGRGLKLKEEFDRIMFLLVDMLGVVVGVFCVVVDSGYVDNSL